VDPHETGEKKGKRRKKRKRKGETQENTVSELLHRTSAAALTCVKMERDRAGIGVLQKRGRGKEERREGGERKKGKKETKKKKIASSSLRFHRIAAFHLCLYLRFASIRSFVISRAIPWRSRHPCKTIVYQSNLSQYRIVYLNVTCNDYQTRPDLTSFDGR